MNFQLKPEDLKLKKSSDYFEYFFSLEDIAERFKQFLQPEEPEKAALVVEGMPQEVIVDAQKLPSLDFDAIKTISIADKPPADASGVAFCDLSKPAHEASHSGKGPTAAKDSQPALGSDLASQGGLPPAGADSPAPAKTELHSA